MGLLELAVGAVITAIARKVIINAHEDKKRRNTPCNFSDGISESDFVAISKCAGRGIKRLTDLSVRGPIVYGKVRSQSGLSDWNFEIDYNDYGHITGKYWLWSSNDDSKIPQVVADRISSSIRCFSESRNASSTDGYDSISSEQPKRIAYCPYCGKLVTTTEAKFCGYCGKKFHTNF